MDIVQFYLLQNVGRLICKYQILSKKIIQNTSILDSKLQDIKFRNSLLAADLIDQCLSMCLT